MVVKNRQRINIWITPEQYDTLWALKDASGKSLNEITQDAIADRVAQDIRLFYPQIAEKYPWGVF